MPSLLRYVITSHSFLQLEDEKVQGLYISKLVRSFCRSSSEAKGKLSDFLGLMLFPPSFLGG